MSDNLLYMLLGACLLLFLWPVSRSKHWFNIRLSHKKLNALKRIPHPAQQMTYCKKINPYVFEEMVLSALAKAGHKIARSASYSGDNGKDGEVVIRGQRYYVQSKCYTNHIKAEHVKAFALLCQKKRVKGLFVHTGKTGKLARTQAMQHVDIISGNRLLKLFTDSHLVVR